MEFRLVRRVGEEAGLEAEALAEAVRLVPAGLDGAVEEVAGVELQAGGVGEDLEGAAAFRVGHAGGEAQRTAEPKVVGVVVAARADELGVVRANALADGVGASEVKGRAFDGCAFAGGDEAFGDGNEAVREELEAVVQDLAAAREVEERVVRQVAERGGCLLYTSDAADE